MVLVYDAGDRRSFENVLRWVQDIKQHATEREVMVMLVANKVDLLAEQRVVSSEMGARLAAEIGGSGGGMGCPYFETSALTGSGVEEAFTSIAEHIASLGNRAPCSCIRAQDPCPWKNLKAVRGRHGRSSGARDRRGARCSRSGSGCSGLCCGRRPSAHRQPRRPASDCQYRCQPLCCSLWPSG